MKTIAELMDLAGRCYAQARAAPDGIVRSGLIRIGDDYLRNADELRRRRGGVVQAVFPRPGPEHRFTISGHGGRHVGVMSGLRAE